MKVNYKKLGSKLSTDDYNALVYILKQQNWSEVVNLYKERTFNGTYGKYIIEDPYNVLSETANGYTILRTDKPFYVKVAPYFDCNYTVMFDVESTITDTTTSIDDNSNVITTMYANDMRDTYESQYYDTVDITPFNEVEKITSKVNALIDTSTAYFDNESKSLASKNGAVLYEDSYITTSLENGYQYIEVDLTKYDYKKDYLISKSCTLALNFNTPIINITDGEYNKDYEILCETFSELKQVIETAPKNSITYIRLTGSNYNFTSEIKIKQKTVHIKGGNLDNDDVPFTTLNANHKCRHFNIDSQSTFTISNCILSKGYAYESDITTTYHHRGGSIYVQSDYQIKGGEYNHLKTVVEITNCHFMFNIADRGGAIYNHNAKVTCNNCVFYRNSAITEIYNEWVDYDESRMEYRQYNLGGAICSESIQGYNYNETNDWLHIAHSWDSTSNFTDEEYLSTFTTSNDITTLTLRFSPIQNTNFLSFNLLTKSNLHLYDYTAKEEITLNSVTPTTVNSKQNHYEYTIKIGAKLNSSHVYYFKASVPKTNYLEMLTKRLNVNYDSGNTTTGYLSEVS